MTLIFLGMLAGKGVLFASEYYSIAQLQDDLPSKGHHGLGAPQ